MGIMSGFGTVMRVLLGQMAPISFLAGAVALCCAAGAGRGYYAIAGAILRNPPILVFDEATSSLDTEAERLVQQAIETLLEGRTVFVIAHRLSTVQRAEQILVLDQGRLVERGTHQALLSAGGLYHRLYALQFSDEEPATGGADPLLQNSPLGDGPSGS